MSGMKKALPGLSLWVHPVAEPALLALHYKTVPFSVHPVQS